MRPTHKANLICGKSIFYDVTHYLIIKGDSVVEPFYRSVNRGQIVFDPPRVWDAKYLNEYSVREIPDYFDFSLDM